jgi:hypothetical protein
MEINLSYAKIQICLSNAKSDKFFVLFSEIYSMKYADSYGTISNNFRCVLDI